MAASSLSCLVSSSSPLTKTLTLRKLSPTKTKTKTLTLTPPLARPVPPLRLAAAAAGDAVTAADFLEKDWSFLESPASVADPARAIAAGEVSPASRVLAAVPTPAFVDALVRAAPCELVVAAHESLLVLAAIKEGHDCVRCFHLDGDASAACGGGVVDAVPERFNSFDVVFVCYFPGMGVAAGELLRSLAAKCSKGARVVIFFDQGRRMVDQHRQQYPDIVSSNLPNRTTLEKAAADNMYQITEFVDEPTLYLAVLRFQG